MKPTNLRKSILILTMFLFILGSFLNPPKDVFSQSGTVVATTAISNPTPEIDDQVTVTVSIDMSAVNSPDNNLGSYTAEMQWNTSVLSYVNHSGAPPSGFAGAVNAENVATGTIIFNGANAAGTSGVTVVIEITFNVIGAGNALLDLDFTAMAAATTFNSLLGILTINEGTIVVDGGETTGVVELDGDVSSSTGAANASSISFDHTTGTGNDRLTMVGISWNAGSTARTVSSVVFSYGESQVMNFNLVRTEQAGTNLRYAAIYRSPTEPPTGTTGTITVTFSGAVTNGIVAGAANFKGVDQTTPLGTHNGANGSSTAASVTLTGLTGNELVFDTVFQGASDAAQTLTAGDNQAQLWNAHVSNTRAAASSEQASSASVTMSWTAASSSIWAIAAVPINPAPAVVVTCYPLTLTAGSNGSPASPSLENSTGCAAGQYVEGQAIGLTANPDWGYEVQAWSGTNNDSSTALTNVVTMPAEARTVHVTYQARTCYQLTLSSGDHGSAPTADPAFSTSCTQADGWYVEGEKVDLTAHPASGYQVASWSGTDDDLSSASTNTLTMPGAAHAVNVSYEVIPSEVALDGLVVYTTSTANTNIVSLDVTTGSGQNRLMLVGVSYNSSQAGSAYITSITFTPEGGSAISLALVKEQWAPPGGTSDPGRMSAIYLLPPSNNPAASTEGTLTVTFSAAFTTGVVVGAANFKGVDQTTPLGEPNSAATSNTVNSVSVDLETTGSELIFDNLWAGGQATTPPWTISPDASQSTLWSSEMTGNTMGASSTKESQPGTTTMSWTRSANGYLSLVAVPINPAIVSVDHTVTFNANGGSGTMAAQTANVPTALTSNAFSREGYTFSGWNTVAGGGGTAYADGDTYNFAADITLFAQWTANPYTVTFNANGGVAPNPTSKVVTFDAAYGALATTSRTGYNFVGWFTTDTGGTQVTAATTVSIASAHTLYAHWTAATYTVTFDANGGVAPNPTSKVVTFGAAYGPLATTSRTDYNFVGWFTAASGGTEVTEAVLVTNASDHTLYAHWTDLPTFTVTFEANGGSGTMSPQIASVPTALTPNTFTRDSFYFNGWNTAANGTGTAYADKALYSFTANITLYAQWSSMPAHAISLKEGWNLVSFNLTPSNPNIEIVLASIMDDVTLVYAWNGMSSSWLRYDPGVTYGNNLTMLDETRGFWINMEVDSTLTIAGTEPTSTSISLHNGWNLIGYPSEINGVLPGVLSGIAGKYELIMAYHKADSTDPWKLYDPVVPGWVNDLNQLEPGWGYWIEMTEPAVLSINFQ